MLFRGVRVWVAGARFAQQEQRQEQLAQVFSNLLINAAKYTEPGGHIRVRAAQEGGEIVLTVSDNGMGISAEMLPHVFTLFAQDRAAREHAQGGLGVGLSLVRGLVSLHGGCVEARSEGAGHGSEFIVRLPVGTPAPQLALAARGGPG